MTRNWLILLYIVGWGASIYIGMQIAYYRTKKQRQSDIERAYNRGWKAGYQHVDRILDAKLDYESAMKILTNQEE